MKKAYLLLLALFAALAAYAGDNTGKALTVRSGIKSYLQSQGYVPSIDSDNDITFKVEGRNYYITCDNYDDGVYVNFYSLLGTEGSPASAVRRAAAEAQKSLKYLRIDMYDNRIAMKVVGYVDSSWEFTRMFSNYLDVLQTGRSRVLEYYEE